MGSLIENILGSLNVNLSSKNKSIIKQINKYEERRIRLVQSENSLRVFADELKREELPDAARLIKDQEELFKRERERLDKMIDDLISKLEPDSAK